MLCYVGLSAPYNGHDVQTKFFPSVYMLNSPMILGQVTNIPYLRSKSDAAALYLY